VLEPPRPAIEPRPAAMTPAAAAEPQAAQEPPLEGVVVDAAAARKRVRDEAFKASLDGAMMRQLAGGR
jgi:O-methyltransferase involved in polyketide biosynthesis